MSITDAARFDLCAFSHVCVQCRYKLIVTCVNTSVACILKFNSVQLFVMHKGSLAGEPLRCGFWRLIAEDVVCLVYLPQLLWYV
jgi:hypothetical protein